MNNPDTTNNATNAPTILVVDDAPENIELLSTILKPYYRVLAATSGQRALDIAAKETELKLILLDVSMPDMDGYEVCRRLKADPSSQSIPVLFVTSKDSASDEVTGLDLGAVDYLTKPVNPALVKARIATHLALYDQSQHLQKLVDARTEALANSNKALKEEIQQRNIALTRIRELRDFDPLTGLPNRDCFSRHLASAIEDEPDDRHAFAVICLDIARFSQINSSYGHETGNQVLKTIADRLSSLLDSREIIGRLGADSFAVLLRPSGIEQDAAGLSARANAAVAVCKQEISLNGQPLMLDIFAGVSTWPEDARNEKDLLSHAEAALNHSVSGDGGTAFFSPSMKQEAKDNLQMEAKLRRAIQQDELIPYYQPQIQIATRQPTGVEALLRWPNPEGGFISPGLFIPLAENLGLIEDIGRLVQYKCFLQLREWQSQLPADFVMSINLSAREFANDNIVEQLRRIATDVGCGTQQVELEVTEHALIHDRKLAIDKLNALRSLGFRLALDDFGTGYSSLSYVKDFPLDKLKIDRSFISDMLAGKREEAIVETIINLSDNLEMVSVAEGVETEQELQTLLKHGCGIAQGFLFSPAIPASEIIGYWQRG